MLKKIIKQKQKNQNGNLFDAFNQASVISFLFHLFCSNHNNYLEILLITTITKKNTFSNTLIPCL